MTKYCFKPVTSDETRCGAFFRLPKEIVKNQSYRSMSSNSKIAYALLWDRRCLSIENGWVEDGLVFVKYSREELALDLGCSLRTAVKVMAELRDYGLIRERRLGLKKSNLIFVGKALPGKEEKSKEEMQKKHVNREADSDIPEEQKMHSNKTYSNNTYKNKTYRKEEKDQQLPPCQEKAIASLWNEIMVPRGKASVKGLSDKRRKTIKARWSEICRSENRAYQWADLETWRDYFLYIAKSPFLMEGSFCDFDWTLKRDNWIKIREGKYHHGGDVR